MNKIDEILVYLYDCVDYSFSYRMKKGLWISKYFDHCNSKNIKNEIRGLNKQKLIQKKQNYDGSIIVSLTEKGKLRALNISFRNFQNKKEKWDGKWRMIAFDVPDEYKKGRDAIRYRMKLGGFYRLQESLFLFPYDCQREINALVKLFKLEKYVRFGLLDFIDNEEQIKSIFKIN